MKLVPVDHLNRRITPDEIKPGAFVKHAIVTKVDQGFVFTQDNLGMEVLIGIIPHVLTDVNKRKCLFGKVEWGEGDLFLMDGKHSWRIVEEWSDSFRIQTHKFITVREKGHFQELIENGRLEPILSKD